MSTPSVQAVMVILLLRARVVIAELYQDLPPHLQDALANDNRRVTFKKFVSFMSCHPFSYLCFINFVVPQAT
jgi:hypothetical protein